ncbi:hypothetical protein CLOM_g3885 [Closterium sp. NIES-68]|nr:hypothetical protein CLOM_g3885 [Closterium sp. NIES-68]
MTHSQVSVRPPFASAGLLTSPPSKSTARATSARAASARATSANACAVSASAVPRPLECLEVSGSPFERGCAIGVRFGDKIRDRVAKAPFLHDDMIPFARTGEGAWLLETLSESNRALYPDYWEELRGMAAGSCVPFDELLLLNLRKEFGAFLPSLGSPATSDTPATSSTPATSAALQEPALGLMNVKQQQEVLPRQTGRCSMAWRLTTALTCCCSLMTWQQWGITRMRTTRLWITASSCTCILTAALLSRRTPMQANCLQLLLPSTVRGWASPWTQCPRRPQRW